MKAIATVGRTTYLALCSGHHTVPTIFYKSTEEVIHVIGAWYPQNWLFTMVHEQTFRISILPPPPPPNREDTHFVNASILYGVILE